MACDCACHSKVVHLQAEFARLTERLERLERDVGREVTDRKTDTTSVRRVINALAGLE